MLGLAYLFSLGLLVFTNDSFAERHGGVLEEREEAPSVPVSASLPGVVQQVTAAAKAGGERKAARLAKIRKAIPYNPPARQVASTSLSAGPIATNSAAQVFRQPLSAKFTSLGNVTLAPLSSSTKATGGAPTPSGAAKSSGYAFAMSTTAPLPAFSLGGGFYNASGGDTKAGAAPAAGGAGGGAGGAMAGGGAKAAAAKEEKKDEKEEKKEEKGQGAQQAKQQKQNNQQQQQAQGQPQAPRQQAAIGGTPGAGPRGEILKTVDPKREVAVDNTAALRSELIALRDMLKFTRGISPDEILRPGVFELFSKNEALLGELKAMLKEQGFALSDDGKVTESPKAPPGNVTYVSLQGEGGGLTPSPSPEVDTLAIKPKKDGTERDL